MSKLLSLNDLKKVVDGLHGEGKCIVFTNGCFDILHAGHCRYLADARGLGDVLVVGLNSDRSMARIKGSLRPIIEQRQRAEVLAALACVDYIVLFDEDNPERLIRTIGPDVLVKGADWPESQIIGADFVKSRGGRVERVAIWPAISTSIIIERIRRRFASDGK
jgi:rfaE bifunctional protein nucleotidyltransferase chain/domain